MAQQHCAGRPQGLATHRRHGTQVSGAEEGGEGAVVVVVVVVVVEVASSVWCSGRGGVDVSRLSELEWFSTVCTAEVGLCCAVLYSPRLILGITVRRNGAVSLPPGDFPDGFRLKLVCIIL